ncbi:MAG: enoyl-CoA hydratase/isomerase family protein [Dehalococcoidia bacterium]|nr:enoyl-CoA hydratase/isomerase family protein [Dehalococcoidia bacterium]
MPYQDLIYEKKDGVAILTFNRPEAMNAGTVQSYAEMGAAVTEAAEDEDVRVLIVTGAGRAFHAGDDVRQIFLGQDQQEREAQWRIRRVKGVITSPLPPLLAFPKPTVAAVNGAAVGEGMEIALCCDIRIASENARFAELFVRRGLEPDFAGFYLLWRIVGLGRAYEIALTGDFVDAAQAERIGLVNKVVAPERLMDEAMAMAERLKKGAPLSQIAIKRGIAKSFSTEWRTMAEYLDSMEALLYQTEDHIEGARSFVERREPQFKGR